MRRGTTPTLVLNIDYQREDIAEAWVTIAQNGRAVINKTLRSDGVEIEDVTDESGTHAALTVTLTQSDTLALAAGAAELQVRALMVDDTAAASEVVSLTVGKILKNGIITLEA